MATHARGHAVRIRQLEREKLFLENRLEQAERIVRLAHEVGSVHLRKRAAEYISRYRLIRLGTCRERMSGQEPQSQR